MAGRLEDKVAVVTGAGSGMGRAIAARFCAEGAKVVAVDISGKEAESAAAAGSNCIACNADVAKSADIQHAIRLAADSFGKLDIICNNAGIQGPLALTADYPEDAWDQV